MRNELTTRRHTAIRGKPTKRERPTTKKTNNGKGISQQRRSNNEKKF
jgi:hypothetical protein